jgi:hypothetical protein
VSRVKNFLFSQLKSRTSGNKAGLAVVLVRAVQNRGWRLSKAMAASFLRAEGYFLWKSAILHLAWARFVAGSQELEPSS